jgi:hypothetical protein
LTDCLKGNHMNTRKITASLVLGSAMLAGCEEGANRNQPGDSDYTPPSQRQTPPSQSDTMGRPSDPSSPGGASAQVQTRAQSLIAEINQHIRSRDFDQAQEKLDQLESLRSQLPQTMQTQIASLRTSLNAARTSGGSGTGSTPPSSTPPSSTPPSSTPPSSTPPTTPPDDEEEEPTTPRSSPGA